MATYYDQLVAKGISKGLSPERAQAAADVKLQREGVSIMSMPTATEAAAPPSRSALVAKGKAAGLPAERAEAAADVKLERDAQKQFAQGGDFSAAVQRAKAVGAEPGASDVVAEVLGPKKSMLPAVGTEGAEAVYAMPTPRPAARIAPAAPAAPDMLPMSALPVEEQLYIENLRRDDSRARATEAERKATGMMIAAAPFAAATPAGPLGTAVTALSAPLVGLGAYALERALPNRVTESERVARSPVFEETTVARGYDPSRPATNLPGGLADILAMRPAAQDTSLSAADLASQRVRRAGEQQNVDSTLAQAFDVERLAPIATGAQIIGGNIADVVSDFPGALSRGVKAITPSAYEEFQRRNMVVGQPTPNINKTPIEAAQSYVIPTEANVVRAENARLVQTAPDKYVPVGPSNDPFSAIASPQDAALVNPQALADYRSRFPQQAAAAEQKAQAAVEGESRVTALGLDMSEPALVRLVQTGKIPETLPSYLRSELGRGDAAEQVRAVKADPKAFKVRARDTSIALGTLPPADAFEGDFSPVEYVAFTVAGRPTGTYEDGSLQLSELGRSSLNTLLRFRKTSPSTYLDMLKTEVEMAQLEQEPE